MPFLNVVDFKNNPDISTSIKSGLSSSMLYIDFSKKGFGFGEISLHNRGVGEFSCMNEMMSRESCVEFFTSFLLNLPKSDTLKIVRHDNAWEMIDVFSNFLSQERKEITKARLNKSKSQEESDEVLINFENYIPSLAVESATFDLETGLIKCVIDVPNSNSFCEVIINSAAVPDVNFYSAFRGKNQTITLSNVEDMLINGDSSFLLVEFLSVWVSALFSENWLKKNKFNTRQFVKELIYFEINGSKLGECSVQTNVPDVQDLEISFLAEKGYAVMLQVKDKKGITNFIGVKQIEGVSKENAYSLTNTSGDDGLVYRVFAHIFSNLVLEDEDHMFISDCFKKIELYPNLNDQFNELNKEISGINTKKEFNVLFKKILHLISDVVEKNEMGWSDDDLSRFKKLAEDKYVSIGNFFE